jgi:hypothetical protein
MSMAKRSVKFATTLRLALQAPPGPLLYGAIEAFRRIDARLCGDDYDIAVELDVSDRTLRRMREAYKRAVAVKAEHLAPKLTRADVRDIFASRARGSTTTSLAKLYGVTPQYVQQILAGKHRRYPEVAA